MPCRPSQNDETIRETEAHCINQFVKYLLQQRISPLVVVHCGVAEADCDPCDGAGVVRDLHGGLVLVLPHLGGHLHQPLVAVGLEHGLGPLKLVVLAVLHQQLEDGVPGDLI